MRRTITPLVLSFLVAVSCPAQAPGGSRLIQAATSSGLPLVQANNNRTAAGVLSGGVLTLDLEIRWGDFRIETDDGPGLRIIAFAEAGRRPSVPGPLIRVESGVTVTASVRNTLTDSTVTVFGLHARPGADPDSLVIPPGEVRSVTFESGRAGTYFYRGRVGNRDSRRGEERDVLSGALIVDPPGGSPPDRIFVMNIWGQRVDSTVAPTRYLEALTINGKSWPFTERLRPAVGDTLRWRVINASSRNHPMHLHGFFYNVLSRGTLLADEVYEARDRRLVVTETMRRHSTMAMEWVPTRPGNWLFHCHLSFHVAPEIRLPRPHAAERDHGGQPHMAGLVLGIEVEPGASDLVWEGDRRDITLFANEYSRDSTYQYGFSLDPEFRPDTVRRPVPGPLLVLQQYQPTYITVENRMTIPTGVHWHGLELDSWADGVPGWSASDGRVSPVIEPGDSFTYKLASMRPGTFIYHSHLDDVHQLTGGLYGPLIVVPQGEEFDAAHDHVAIAGWRTPNPRSVADVELNGRTVQLEQHAVVGENHRIRLINIAPAGMIRARMLRDSVLVPMVAWAKDGADLPEHQRVDVEVTPRLGVGETADYVFEPSEPGTYELVVGFGNRSTWRQRWEVLER